MTKKLCIIGAGPKAAAIIARASVLAELGHQVPEITVIEEAAIGAAWSGTFGFSNGYLTLCSPAEKDVGFPYFETTRATDGASIAGKLFARFSWQAYLVDVGRYSNWVDRGRDHPTHQTWSKYLSWVFDVAGTIPTSGKVMEVSQSGGRWEVTFTASGDVRTDVFDGVVLTGVGTPHRIDESSAIPDARVFDPKTFWPSTDAFRMLPQETRIVVVGGGGSAGAIIAWLASAHAESDISIISLCSRGALLPRGDGFSERKWFTDPEGWEELPLNDRRFLLSHTEEGVISLRNKTTIDKCHFVDYFAGRANSVGWDPVGSGELLVSATSTSGEHVNMPADYLINAMGFDPWSQLDVIKSPSSKSLIENSKTREAAQLSMLRSLDFDSSVGMERLHVPSLAALQWGPGMATLGCLGRVAQSILGAYGCP